MDRQDKDVVVRIWRFLSIVILICVVIGNGIAMIAGTFTMRGAMEVLRFTVIFIGLLFVGIYALMFLHHKLDA